MDLGLRNTVAVVAASSEGIGRAVAEGFAREGARVVVNGRHEAPLGNVAEAIRSETGAEVETVVADVSTMEGCANLIDSAVRRFGGIDSLFVNAGGPPSKPFEELTDDEWRAAGELTLMSAVRLIREALPHLRRSRGSVVLLTSVSVKQPVAGLILSDTLRPGVVGLAKALSEELAPDGVRINNVGPGSIWTGRQEYLVRTRAEHLGIDEAEARKRAEQSIPMQRFGTPEEVANMAIFLASPAASYVTGQTVLVDGGVYRGLM